jgi:hypothetical protein
MLRDPMASCKHFLSTQEVAAVRKIKVPVLKGLAF